MIFSDFETIAAGAWEQTPLEQMYEACGVMEEPPDEDRFIIYIAGQAQTCRICGRADRWQKEGAAWVCEHDPEPEITGLFPIRMVDSKPVGQIEEWESA